MMNFNDAETKGVRPRFLVILYGHLEYDGRVKRMLSVLSELGYVTLVDLLPTKEIVYPLQTEHALDRLSFPRRSNGSKIAHHLLFWKYAISAARRIRPDIVVAENFHSTMPGWISAKMLRAAFAYDAYELIIPHEGEVMSKRSQFWYRLERLTVKRTHLIITANKDRATLMAEHYKLLSAPAVMHNIPPRMPTVHKDTDLLVEFPSLARSTTDECLVLYQGYVTLDRGIQRFVDALEYLPDQFRLVIAGGGPDLEKLRLSARHYLAQGRFTTLGRITHSKLPAITQTADVGIVTYPYTGLNNIYCAPNKVFEYAQADVPIVATDQPPLKRMIEKYSIGALVGRQDSPQRIAEIIQSVWRQGKAQWKPALESFLENHRWEDESARLREELQAILP